MMTPHQNILLSVDHRSLRDFALQWLSVRSRGGRWTGPPPSRGQRLANLAWGIALLPRMAIRPGVVEQMRRRLEKGVTIVAEHQLSPALVLATHQLQKRSRAGDQPI